MVEKQTAIIPKSEKIPMKGATVVFNPVGSQYKDPETKQTVTRTEATLQYAKAGVPAKWAIGIADVENLRELFASKKFLEEWAIRLPEVATLEPNSV